MKTLTLSESERELKSIFAAVRNGEHLVVTRGDEQIEIVPDSQIDVALEPSEYPKYTEAQRQALDLGWSPAVVATLDELDPEADEQPNPFPRVQDRPPSRSIFDEEV